MIDINHVHPMLVHFPIVLFLTAVALQLGVVARGGDLAAAEYLPRTALYALLLGTLGAAAAAVFGDIALENALELGFPEQALDEHEDLGLTTTATFVALSAVQLGARWRGIALTGGKGWVVAALGVAGLGILISTAAHGGELVYRLGVNVAAVTP